MKTKGKGRFRRGALALSIGIAIAFLLAEGGLRILLFWDGLAPKQLASHLRQPSYYSDMRREGLYWKLLRIWTPPDQRQRLGRFSPRTGWTGAQIDHVSLVMKDETRVRGRRPVLLYGDSFAESVTSPRHAWQGLLERSPEGRTHALVNFGTSGFGTDQTLMMLEATIDRYAKRNPLVIFSLFLDEDADRTMLDFRGMPKPRFELAGDELVFRPLEETDAYTWFDEHPPSVVSYLWRLCCGSAGPLPRSWQEKLSPAASDEQVIALNRALLTRMHQRLKAMNIEHFVLGFHGRMMLDDPATHRWREDFVREICRELDMPILTTGPYLMKAANSDRAILGPKLFVTEGMGEGHYNELGNCAAFEAIRQGIRGQFGQEDTSGVEAALQLQATNLHPTETMPLCSLGLPATLQFSGGGLARSLREVMDETRLETRLLGLHPDSELPVRIEWELEQSARFVAEARAVQSFATGEIPEAVQLRLLVDGITVRSVALVPGDPALRLDHELRAPCRFTLSVEPVEGYSRSCWAQLERPAFR